MSALRIILFGFGLLAVTGCTARPDAEAELGADPAGSDFPTILPVDQILAADTGDPATTAEADAALAARVAALKARAAALRRLKTP
jgi:hypothetical protein